MRITRGSRAAYVAFGLLVGLLSLVTTGLHAQANSTMGMWRLNVAKSKYNPGPAPMSESRVYEAFGAGGIKATFTRVEVGGVKSSSATQRSTMARTTHTPARPTPTPSP